jgi:Fe-S cluster assembly protein SufD
MDEEKLFYLMSRGIPRAQAQEVLAHAFVGDVLMKIEATVLHRFADENVRGWLPDFMSGMEASV